MAIINDKPGPHVINGTDYSDTIKSTNDGNDTVYAKLGDDWVFGGDGHDRALWRLEVHSLDLRRQRLPRRRVRQRQHLCWIGQ